MKPDEIAAERARAKEAWKTAHAATERGMKAEAERDKAHGALDIAQKRIEKAEENWTYYQEFCKTHGFGGITDAVTRAKKAEAERDSIRLALDALTDAMKVVPTKIVDARYDALREAAAHIAMYPDAHYRILALIDNPKQGG